jgi:hypothetical protein
MLYDCTIVFWLSQARTRPWAYLAVVVFHTITGLMFQIGVFPVVMIGATLIFFPAAFHERVLNGIWKLIKIPLRVFNPFPSGESLSRTLAGRMRVGLTTRSRNILLAAYLLFQLLFPWRYLLYPGNLFWTEQGYRFSWRVMLMEKAGTATFYVKDGRTGREGVVNNGDFLCAHQEKQMAMQPDMIVQFARFLEKYYAENGVSRPAVRAEVYVTLNAQPSRLLIDPNIDLSKIEDDWKHKDWILPDE